MSLALGERRRPVTPGEAALRGNALSYHVGADWSGSGTWAGRVGGAATVTVGTKSGKHVDLTASGSYVDLPAAALPTFTATTGERFVLVCYSQPATNDANDRLLSSESSASKGEFVYFAPAIIRTAVGGNTATINPFVSQTSIANDAIEVSGFTIGATGMKLYRRGVGLSSASAMTGAGTIVHGSTVRVGANAFNAGNKSNVRLFSVAVGNTDQTLTAMNLMADEMAAQAAA